MKRPHQFTRDETICIAFVAAALGVFGGALSQNPAGLAGVCCLISLWFFTRG